MFLESTTDRLEDALERLANDASALFEDLLSAGAEIPFEIEATEGRGALAMYQYTPRTAEFIQSHTAELRRLESYVEIREIAGEETATGFLIGLWAERSEFTCTPSQLRGAIDGALTSLPGTPQAATSAGEVIVPLIGFHMPADEINLDGVRIVRADSIDDAPMAAIDLTRAGKNSKPGFVAQVSCGLAVVAPAAAVADDLRRAVRTLRLFKAGNVGLAAVGWARRPDGWERFESGAHRPRQGGYRLTGNEAADLEAFARTLVERGSRVPSLDWAVSRFDLGAERASMIEGLSDYLLALRGLLEGGGTMRAGMSARLGALACESHEREQARVSIERALGLERKLMSGGRYRPEDGQSPLDLIATVEDLLRRLLKRMATGELGADLRAAADDKLLAHGLNAGTISSPQVGETAEWRIPDLSDDPVVVPEPASGEISIHRVGTSVPAGTQGGFMSEHEPSHQAPAPQVEVEEPIFERPVPQERPDWFSAPDGDGEPEWPAFATPRRETPAGEGREHSSDRVSYLFPVPDATDWDVGELSYQRKLSREVRPGEHRTGS